MTISFGFVRELVRNGEIQVTHISMRDQIVDVFTKPLSSLRFLEIRFKFGVVYANLRRNIGILSQLIFFITCFSFIVQISNKPRSIVIMVLLQTCV